MEIIVSRRRFGVAESYRPPSSSARLALTLLFTVNTLVLLVLLAYLIFPRIGQEGKNVLWDFVKIGEILRQPRSFRYDLFDVPVGLTRP